MRSKVRGFYGLLRGSKQYFSKLEGVLIIPIQRSKMSSGSKLSEDVWRSRGNLKNQLMVQCLCYRVNSFASCEALKADDWCSGHFAKRFYFSVIRCGEFTYRAEDPSAAPQLAARDRLPQPQHTLRPGSSRTACSPQGRTPATLVSSRDAIATRRRHQKLPDPGKVPILLPNNVKRRTQALSGDDRHR